MNGGRRERACKDTEQHLIVGSVVDYAQQTRIIAQAHTLANKYTQTHTLACRLTATLLGQPVSVSGTPLEERETTQSVKSEGRCALFGLRTRSETKPTTTTATTAKAAQQAKMKSSSGRKKMK